MYGSGRGRPNQVQLVPVVAGVCLPVACWLASLPIAIFVCYPAASRVRRLLLRVSVVWLAHHPMGHRHGKPIKKMQSKKLSAKIKKLL